jgi:hypothetical protein
LKIYSQCLAERKDYSNLLELDRGDVSQRFVNQRIRTAYREMLRDQIRLQQQRYPDLGWMVLYQIWRSVARRRLFDVLFAAHLADGGTFISSTERKEQHATN